MKHYANSEEKFVKAVVAYADADDGHLFSDAKKSVKSFTLDGGIWMDADASNNNWNK